MPNFNSYGVSIRGTGAGIEPSVRAAVTLQQDSTHIGSIRFWDAGPTIPADSSVSPLIMNLPIALLPAAMGIPLQINWNATFARLILHTATAEPVGEDET
jgi:hypothetical protein